MTPLRVPLPAGIALLLAIAGPACVRATDAADSVSVAAPRTVPGFSWDRVPLFAHLGKWEGPFTETELRHLARFPYVFLEKTQEYRVRGVPAEEGIVRAARALKAIAPETQVGYYWNSFLAYEMYSAVADLGPEREWAIHNLDGSVYRHRGERACFDLARPEVRRWWLDEAARVVREHGDVLDVFFVDAVLAGSHSARADLWGEEGAAAIHAGMDRLMADLHAEVGDDIRIVYNGAGTRARKWEDRGLRYGAFAGGVMFEHFAGCSMRNPPGEELKPGWLDEEIELVRRAAQSGLAVFVKGWPRSKACLNRPGVTDEETMRRDLLFPLAAFLVAAEENCFFLYNWGYTNHDGQYLWYDEYDRPLGPPLGPPERNGSVWTRAFRHATVRVDTAAEEAEIVWELPAVPRTAP